jgi:fused signal recognition particle receptor
MTEDGAAGWLGRLQRGLGRSSAKIAEGIAGILTKRAPGEETLNALEEALIGADLGVAVAGRLRATLAQVRFAKDTGEAEIRRRLADEIAAILIPAARPLAIDPARKPHVVLVCGVNGSGKTTTIGKLAKSWRDEGRRVVLVAGDTFRAAAIEQLRIWGERAGCPVVAGAPGADAAGLAFSALEKARAEGADVLVIDTAGRLHNKADLMAELAKIVRVLKKIDPTAPHDCVLVMDATIGQNAVSQVKTFRELINVTGLILTKLDGSAKGGVVVALAEQFGLPVHAVGVGEGVDDLRPFAADAFARALMGLKD